MYRAYGRVSRVVPETTKAAQVIAFGGYDQITIADIFDRAPIRGQVPVRVAAAGVGH